MAMRMEALEAGTGHGPDSSADIERLDGIVSELREDKDALFPTARISFVLNYRLKQIIV